MRVISGSARGMQLRVPKSDLRPTMDLVKSAIFSTLADLVPGARVLDLFAGTGSLGIEALSRGAASATFVEKDPRAVEATRQNLEKARLAGRVEAMDVFSFLDRFAQPESYEMIFADPPYVKKPGERDFASELLTNAALARAVAPRGFFVLEHLPGVELPLGPWWECTRDRRYGATAVAFLVPVREQLPS